MRPLRFFILLLLLSLVLSCSRNAEIKHFVISFAQAVDSGQKSVVDSMYPDAVRADSLLSFGSDSIKVNKSKTESEYYISLGNNRSLVLAQKQDDNKSFLIKESYGLFYWPKDMLDFAIKTGWIESGMNDIQISERLNDTEFLSSLVNSFESSLKKKLTVKISGAYGNHSYGGYWVASDGLYAKISNNSEFDIPGNSYYVVHRTGYWGSFPRHAKSEHIDGVDLAPGESKVVTTRLGSNMESENDLNIFFHENGVNELLFKYYQAKGDEYAEYLATKAQ